MYKKLKPLAFFITTKLFGRHWNPTFYYILGSSPFVTIISRMMVGLLVIHTLGVLKKQKRKKKRTGHNEINRKHTHCRYIYIYI